MTQTEVHEESGEPVWLKKNISALINSRMHRQQTYTLTAVSCELAFLGSWSFKYLDWNYGLK